MVMKVINFLMNVQIHLFIYNEQLSCLKNLPSNNGDFLIILHELCYLYDDLSMLN